MHPIHRIVFPGEGTRDADLYLRPQAGRAFTTDTYFGLFPLAAWRRLAALDALSLRIAGRGACHVTLRDFASRQPLGDARLELAGETTLPLDPWIAGQTHDAVYLDLDVAPASQIDALTFETEAPARRPVHLALVVTTFGRPDAVRAVVERLAAIAASPPEPNYGRISLVVVDNGRELDPALAPAGAVILPNPNLGGAGGFARGLAHATDLGATHALFMDDDAATETECLLRARRLLAFAIDPDTAVAAAMLRAETSFMMHEQGAVFEWGRTHRIISRKNGLDLRQHDALRRILEPEPVGYGGWWFFAFPIGPDLRYPFPMFVRGDDWLFSYLNRFRIETMPGICAWQEGFENKIGPAEQYLAMKAFLTAELMLREGRDLPATTRFFAAWITRNVHGYCYDRAAMNLAALKDVLSGPSFWENNVDLTRRLAELDRRIRWERREPVVHGELRRAIRPERLRKRLLRTATLNGHLLPRALTDRLAERRIAIPLSDAPQPRLAFPHAEIAYVGDHRSFLARRNTRLALAQLASLAWLLVRLAWSFNSLQRQYRAAVDRFCTRSWWDRVRRELGAPTSPTNRTFDTTPSDVRANVNIAPSTVE